MTAVELIELIAERPFKPLRIHLADGRIREIRHPEMAFISETLVAIGGITRNNARSVVEAGADSVAVISDLIRDPRKSAEAFFEILR